MDGEITSLGSPLALLLLRTSLIALAIAVVGGVVSGVRARRKAASLPTASVAEPPARKFLRISTGALWVVDGLLQAQPLMPAGFISADIQPSAVHDPGWLRSLVGMLGRAWERHPVSADAALVEAEIGLGLLLILASHGRLSRAAAYGAGAFALLVWVLGEGFGGLLSSGAGWLTGAPGAVLVYVAAAALLLLPFEWWPDGRGARAVRLAVTAWLVVAGSLQCLPAEGFWSGRGLAAPFAQGASMPQPSWLNAPMPRLAAVASSHPGALNGLVVALVLGSAAWLIVDRTARPVVAALVLCAATWWLAQDFGVLGGTATDPGTALPLALLLAAALPVWLRKPEVFDTDAIWQRGRPVLPRRFGVALALTLAFALPVVLALGVIGPADRSALAADSHGGMRAVPARPVPPFALTDQDGHRITTATVRGKVVVVTFLDPVCTSECPLIAGQLAAADRDLGVLGSRVEFLAIDSNPVFHSQGDVAAFSRSHGLTGLSNWHFLCGPPGRVQAVMAAFGMGVNVPVVGMIAHSSGVFFVAGDGREAAYLDDGASAQLTTTYAQAVEREVRTLAR